MTSPPAPRSTLRARRLALGWSQARLGEAAGISRQGYAAVESGRSVPSVEVALRLARSLGTEVETLFGDALERPAPIAMTPSGLGEPGGLMGRRVRVVQVGGRRVGHALDAGGLHFGVAADGVAERGPDGEAHVRPFADPPPPPDLVVAGCDPAFGLVADFLRREHGLEVLVVPAGSRASLEALARGAIHAAGIHLLDSRTGSYNEPWIRRLLPFPATRVSFATWEQTLVVRPGNPLGIGSVADLARPGVRLLNREPGSGSRSLLKRRLTEAGVPVEAVPGFCETAADGHVTVGGAVASGAADAGVAIRAVALARGLPALSLGTEPYDLVVADHALELPAVGALLAALRRPALQRQVEALGGYDVQGMGRPA